MHVFVQFVEQSVMVEAAGGFLQELMDRESSGKPELEVGVGELKEIMLECGHTFVLATLSAVWLKLPLLFFSAGTKGERIHGQAIFGRGVAREKASSAS